MPVKNNARSNVTGVLAIGALLAVMAAAFQAPAVSGAPALGSGGSTESIAPDGSGCDGSTNCISAVDDTTPANGQTITLTGYHFDDLDKSNWDPFFTTHTNAWSFEGAAVEADGYTNNGGAYTSAVHLYGSKSFVSDSNTTTRGPGEGGAYAHVLNLDMDGVSDWWIGVDAAWTHNGTGWPDAHIKFLYNLNGGYYLNPAHGSGYPNEFDSVHDANDHYRKIPDGKLVANRWYRFKLHWQQGTARTFAVWVDGQQIYSSTPANDYPQQHLLFGIVNWCCGTRHITNWLDGLYVGTTSASADPPAAVYLDGCGGGLTADKVWQPRTAVSTTSITITYTKRGQARGAKCLYVVNQAGVTSAGFPVTNP